jgi:hypothetical protein
MADIKMTQRYALRQARVRALRIVAAYASIRELSESEFCKLYRPQVYLNRKLAVGALATY